MQENINLVASGEGDYRSKLGGKMTSSSIYSYLLSVSSVYYMPGTVLLSTVQILRYFIYFKILLYSFHFLPDLCVTFAITKMSLY